MKARLCVQFCKVTKEHFDIMLRPRDEFHENGSIIKVDQNVDIESVIVALKQTIGFERVY